MNAIARWRGRTTPGRGLAALIVTALVLTVAGVPATASDDGMVEATYTYTDTQTVTVDETYTIGEFVGHGSATATASATVTKTVRKPSDWEAYYYSIWESYLAAVQEAHDKAVAEAQPIAKKKAEEDAQAAKKRQVTSLCPVSRLSCRRARVAFKRACFIMCFIAFSLRSTYCCRGFVRFKFIHNFIIESRAER